MIIHLNDNLTLGQLREWTRDLPDNTDIGIFIGEGSAYPMVDRLEAIEISHTPDEIPTHGINLMIEVRHMADIMAEPNTPPLIEED